MRVHNLKIKKKYFEDVKAGVKKFELRRCDRGYEVGDVLILNEFDNGKATGRNHKVKVSYILKNVSEYGLKDGYCILGWK